MDPAMFPVRVPVMVPYLTMGLGLVAGVFLTTLIFLLTIPEGQARLLNRHGQELDVDRESGGTVQASDRPRVVSGLPANGASPGTLVCRGVAREVRPLSVSTPSLSLVQPRGDETWIDSPTQGWRMRR